MEGEVKKVFFIVLIIASSILSISNIYCKEKVIVFDFSTIGVGETLTHSVGQLFRYEFASKWDFEVVERKEMIDKFGEDIQVFGKKDAIEKGKIVDADKAVFGEIDRLGEKIVVTAMIVDVSSELLEYSQTISAQSVEDLEIVIQRLVESLVKKRPFAETAEVEKITEKETFEPRRRKSFYTFGIKLGHIEPIAGFAGVSKGRIEWGLRGWYETPAFVTELAWTLNSPFETFDYSPTSFSDQRVEISLLKTFSKKDISPYAGGGLGIHWVTVSSDDEWSYSYYSSSGIGANISGGMMFFRTYDFRLVVNISYHIVAVELGDDNINHAISIGISLLHKEEREENKGCISCLGF
jgi:hypothetical protein